jgi:hypothetical protein
MAKNAQLEVKVIAMEAQNDIWKPKFNIKVVLSLAKTVLCLV